MVKFPPTPPFPAISDSRKVNSTTLSFMSPVAPVTSYLSSIMDQCLVMGSGTADRSLRKPQSAIAYPLPIKAFPSLIPTVI